MKNKKQTFLYKNSLSIVLILLFLLSISGQIYTGWKQYNEELSSLDGTELSLIQYITSGHFIESTFENWESEFLQMAIYVLLTVFLRQKGSAESNPLAEDAPDKLTTSTQLPLKRKIWVSIYNNSLTIVLFVLFIISFALHYMGSLNEYNIEQELKGLHKESFIEFASNSKLWFESFQNWQSEFISVLAIVLLSIFLRQKGSPESKPVEASDSDTGN